MTKLFEKVKAFGWENCYRLRSGRLEMILTADVGPRILFFGLEGGKNLLKIVENQLGRKDDLEWQLYGGHRLWAAPEDPHLSYLPDNQALLVEFDNDDGSLSFTRSADASGLERKLSILQITQNLDIVGHSCEKDTYRSFLESFFKKDGTLVGKEMKVLGHFIVRNEIVNRSQEVIKTASWGITSFTAGGIGYLPMEKNNNSEKRFQANRRLNLWDYASLRDPAYHWEDEHLEIHQALARGKQKVGTWAAKPWLAYRLDNLLSLIHLPMEQESAENYPDQGSNIEIYFDQDMLELEMLSPWKSLQSGESVWHDEIWSLFDLSPDNLQ